MLAPHLNPAIDAHLRFRLSLQVSNVKALVESPQSVWMTAYMPDEVHKFRTKFMYGWQQQSRTYLESIKFRSTTRMKRKSPRGTSGL